MSTVRLVSLLLVLSTADSFLARLSSTRHRNEVAVACRSEPETSNYWGDDTDDQDTLQPSLTPLSSFAASPALFELDPASDQARDIVMNDLKLSGAQHEQLVSLCQAVVDWNDRINLVSRKDCTVATVFGRHVLPSIACCAFPEDQNPLNTAKTLVDVGTGGGFPGLPLAIAYPDVQFVLLDSVGKKLTAAQDMANALGLDHVRTHHRRAEDLRDEVFDVATGRSVSAIPQFCAWMQHLVKPTGHLLYWIGGDVDASILEQTVSDTPIESLVPDMESDKRILILPQLAVKRIAKASGISVQPSPTNRSQRKRPSSQRKTTAKGSWSRRNSEEPKQRGYEGFKRYSSS